MAANFAANWGSRGCCDRNIDILQVSCVNFGKIPQNLLGLQQLFTKVGTVLNVLVQPYRVATSCLVDFLEQSCSNETYRVAVILLDFTVKRYKQT